eukprot:RCo044718
MGRSGLCLLSPLECRVVNGWVGTWGGDALGILLQRSRDLLVSGSWHGEWEEHFVSTSPLLRHLLRLMFLLLVLVVAMGTGCWIFFLRRTPSIARVLRARVWCTGHFSLLRGVGEG